MGKRVEVIKEGRLATVRLNNPGALNAMDGEMMKELAEVVEKLQHEQDVQIIKFEGEGKAFSAGGDVKAMLQPSSAAQMEDIMDALGRLAVAIYRLPQLTIAAVQGAAAGLGCSVAIACDIVIAEPSSKLAMNFIGIGLVPDGGGHFFLKERVGVQKAKQLIWSGSVLDGESAKALGIVDQLAEEGTVKETAKQFADRLLQSPIAAMQATKQILHAEKTEELQRSVDLERQAQAAMRQTEDHREGIQAFVEKRPPRFIGK